VCLLVGVLTLMDVGSMTESIYPREAYVNR